MGISYSSGYGYFVFIMARDDVQHSALKLTKLKGSTCLQGMVWRSAHFTEVFEPWRLTRKTFSTGLVCDRRNKKSSFVSGDVIVGTLISYAPYLPQNVCWHCGWKHPCTTTWHSSTRSIRVCCYKRTSAMVAPLTDVWCRRS